MALFWSKEINQTRLLYLDVFRDIAMVLMILVNSIGTRHAYPVLIYVQWNGNKLGRLYG
jgi:predicted acyltransferase